MTEGTLLYCDPFVFKNGAAPKPKYFIVLANTDDDLNRMGASIQNLGVLKPEILADLKACLKQATNIKRKYLKWL